MKHIIIFTSLLYILTACNNTSKPDAHDHSGHDHPHTEQKDAHSGHDHGDVKLQFTAYSNEFEVFAEADPLVVGKKTTILAHFSHLPNFTALEAGEVTAKILVNGKISEQTLKRPRKKGIYRFRIKAEHAGKAEILFVIKTKEGQFEVKVPNLKVYKNGHNAIHAAEAVELPSVNTVVFTKEQSWRIDFATEQAKQEPFGQVIKTSALIQSAQGDEVFLTAKASGIVILSDNDVLEGEAVRNGQVLFSISGSGLADDNSTIKFVEAKNEYERAKVEYNRHQELAKEKIVSEKELLDAKNQYDNAKINFESLSKHFNTSGQKVTSSMNGFITQVFVQNGQHVEAGQAVLKISQNKTMRLSADVQQKYAHILGTAYSANIRTLYNNQTYSLGELNGKILSYGKNTNSDNYLVPISLQIDNNGSFVSGGFVELFLKTMSNTNAITIPNSALLEEQGSFFVFVQATPELFEKREIKIGATDGLRTEILKGISSHERVVSEGAVLIKLSQASGALDPHAGHVH